MGVFDVHCAVSGLALSGDTRLVLLASQADGPFRAVAIPLRGSYDRYGSVDMIKAGPNASAIEGLREELDTPYPPEDLEEMLRTLNHGTAEDDWGQWQDHRISFALVDGGIYRAVVDTVTRDDRPEWTEYHADMLANLEWQQLYDRAFGASPLSARIYNRLSDEDRRTLRGPLAQLLVFLRFGAELTPIDIFDSDQYCGLHGEFGCADHVAAARARFADYPRLLAAVDRNEQQWQELDDEEDD